MTDLLITKLRQHWLSHTELLVSYLVIMIASWLFRPVDLVHGHAYLSDGR